MALAFGIFATSGCANLSKVSTPPVAEGGNSASTVKDISPRQRAQSVVQQLSLQQKIRLVTGVGFAYGPGGSSLVPGAAGATYGIPELGVPSIVLADGPAGLRINPTRKNDSGTYYATAFPVATVLASSWNIGLVEQVGQAMGNEAKAYGVDIILGPGMNIHMNPLGGRNFEYFSEDPLVTGKMAGAIVRGIQGSGVGATLKHYVANNIETNRLVLDAQIDERALREIYLKGFEIAVRESQPWAIMSSYNKLNGVYTSQSKPLLIDILRNEWKFTGMVMTDWFSGDDSAAQMQAGNDLIMPGVELNREEIEQALAAGRLSEADLDRNLINILGIVFQSLKSSGHRHDNTPDLKSHARFARQVATEGVVLLKNDDGALPMPSRAKVAVFGFTSYDFISGGIGSGDVNEAYTISLVEALQAQQFTLNETLKRQYDEYVRQKKAKQPQRTDLSQSIPPIPEMAITKEMVHSAARTEDLAVITLGRNTGELHDGQVEWGFNLTDTERQLLDEVSSAFHAVGKKVVVILNVGSVIETASWKTKVDAIVLPWQGGQEAGHAVVDVLSGVVNPSGKLPATFPNRYEDVPSSKTFPGRVLDDTIIENPYHVRKRPRGKRTEMIYEDGIFVGYRYYDSFNQPTSYAFGCGLSYTQFAFSDMVVEVDDPQTYVIKVKVTNTGSKAGKEVVQIYATAPKDSHLAKPAHELKAFQKTRLLAPNESQQLQLHVKNDSLASFDDKRRQWVLEPGEYILRATDCSKNTGLSKPLTIADEQLLSAPLTPLPPTVPVVSRSDESN